MAPLRRRLHLFPSWEVLPFENLSPHPENIAGRLEGLYKLIEEPAPILIATPAALMQRVIPKEALKKSYLYIVVGQDLPREGLLDHLIHWGFQNVPLVEERGDFSVRGGIVDLFPPGYGRPIRLEFDGDRLESIREFNPANQRTEAVQEEFILLPMKEFALKRAGIEESLKRSGAARAGVASRSARAASAARIAPRRHPRGRSGILAAVFLSRLGAGDHLFAGQHAGLARWRRPRRSGKRALWPACLGAQPAGPRRPPPGGAGGAALLKRT